MLLDQKKQQKNSSKKNRKRDQLFVMRGFTLIEFIIVIAIILLMTSVAAVNMNKNKGANEVENAALLVVAQLRALQNDAVNGKSVGGTAVCQFKFDIVDGEKKYTTTLKDCAATPATLGTPFVGYFSSKQDNGSVAGSATSFTFLPPLGSVNSAGQITLTAGADKYYVCVSLAGSILAQSTLCP